MKQNHYESCKLLWREPQINWNGMLLGCCCNCWKDYGVNVFEVGLEKALSTDLYNLTKEMLLGHIPGRKESPCFSCHYYKRMVQNNDYIQEDEISEMKTS